MDVTPQVINEVEFHQKMRGYDPDEVDDFLERVAVAFEQMQDRIRSAEQRASAAEQRGADPSRRPAAAATATDDTDETETIRRTLVLAQRTADAAIKDAKDEAQRILAAAQEQSQRQQAEAQEQARKLVVDAEAEARKSGDETRQRLIKEIIALEETRDALRADHGILERHLDEQRLRLRSSIGELQRLLDDPARLRAAAPPEVSGATRPDFVEDVDVEAASADADANGNRTPTAERDDAPVEANEDVVIDLDAPVTADRSADDEVEALDAVEARPKPGGVTFTPPDETSAPGEPMKSERSVTLVTDMTEDEAWAQFTQGDVDRPTMAVSTIDASEDAYLSELRKAMLDDTSASTLDPGEHRARTRFGRRR